MSDSQIKLDLLVLKGRQINFTNRKTFYTSNMSARPSSAISINQSCKYVENENLSSQRPVSADSIFCNDKSFENNFQNIETNEYCDTLPTKECKEQISNLPSSHILQSLLSEALNLRDWKDEKTLQKTSSYESIDSALESEKSLGQKIKELAQKNNPGTLIPGLTSKPPLPDKNKKNNFQLDIYPMQEETNIEENFDDRYSRYIETRATDNCIVEDLEEELGKLDEIQNNIDDLTLEENKSLKTWLQESNNLMLETKLFESQTDFDLQNLHQQQIEINETIYDLNGKTPKSSRINSGNKLNLKTPEKSTTNKNKIPKPNNNNNNNQKINKLFKKPPKSILKPKKPSSPPKQEIKNIPIRASVSNADINPSQNDNINTWMSSSNGKNEGFLDFLNKLDDLEQLQESEKEIIAGGNFQDVPEHDQDDINISTSDEIASILQVLEKEDLKSQKNIETMKEMLNTEICSSSGIQKDADTRCSSTSSLDSATNFNEFLSYLEEADQNSVKTLKTAKERVKTVTKLTNTVLNVDTIPRLEELLNYSTVELAHYAVDMSLKLKEKSSGISTLQTELSKLRNLINVKSEEFEKSLKQKLKSQQNEYESTVKRHQKFIDQLIADKKSLNQQCESLINEMKVLEDRYSSNIKALEQRHKIDLQKAKDMHLASEKLRREKWLEGKTQKIKEMTIKGLEPELQNMSTRHQQELSDLRSLHKRELEDLELRAARKTQQQCEVLRQQLTTEREAAIAHEREILRQRLEKLVESEEKSYQEQRRRLNSEHASRLAECEDRINAIIAEKERAIEAAKSEFEDKLQTAARRHKTEVKNLRESMDLELEVWKNNFKKTQSLKISEIEAQLRDVCKQERDREIEMVIERLEKEADDMKTQTEQAADNRLRRIKDKYEEEIKDLEKIVEEYKQKYSETKDKLLTQDDTIINLKSTMQQLQRQLQQSKQISDEYSKDKNKIKEQVKEEFIKEIKTLEDEMKTLKNNREEEMQRIFAKVKITVARKDELLSELTQSNKNLHEKCTLLENLLEQQRKDYLIKS